VKKPPRPLGQSTVDGQETLRQAVQFHQQGRLNDADSLYRAILKAQPAHVEANHFLGVVRLQQGRNAEALDLIGAALRANPNSPLALTNFGTALERLGRPEAALASFDQALALKPDFVQALHCRGQALLALGRPQEALASYDRALAIRPGDANALANRAMALVALGRPEAALASFDRAIAIAPGHFEALNYRGAALLAVNRPEAALASFERAIAIRPDYAEAFNNRAIALNALKRLEQALASLDQALALKPDFSEAFCNRGNALKALGRFDAALASYDRAIALNPGNAEYFRNKGDLLAELGHVDEAVAAIETSITLAPRRTRAYYSLTLFKRMTPEDRNFRAMEALARDMNSLSADEQINLDFALAKAYADIGDPERSFRRLAEGNALKRKSIAYDETAALDFFARIRKTFTAALMRELAGAGEASRAPVFILGMQRSGTTLVEQILASHPKVLAAGERDDFEQSVAELQRAATGGLQFPEMFAQASGEDLRRLGAIYLRRIGVAESHAARITDKMPGNFLRVGLIRLALPNARIIHARRDPMDTCFSCFTQSFVENPPYVYDLAELGRYYRGYEGLMAHWREVLPEGAMLEVQYEDVVADLEGQARRIVAHCGLEWDARCLEFYRTERQVRTASLVQVRQPIFKSSIGRWRAYEAFLGPLREALAAGAG
jgi:tetratricopeptide (TPR) repeat protein